MARGEDTFAAFIDFSKAFDSVDRNLLLFKLLRYNINGNIYFAIKKLYQNTVNCIRLNSFFSKWFKSEYGVRQGDVLSPTLFDIYLNDLALKINSCKLGIKVGNRFVGILLYADDIVLIADSELKLQQMLDILSDWCRDWRLIVNKSKSEIVHFRKSRKKKTTFQFKLSGKNLSIVYKYKYLGVILDEYLNFQECAQTLADSAGRALGSVISKFNAFKDIGFYTYTKLFDSSIWPILDYCSSIWKFYSCN